MALGVLILGESGTGKSASMRNFNKDEICLINVANKPLPFRGGFESLATDSYRAIKKQLSSTHKKVIVIDDSQYLMANEFMRRGTEKGFDKFTEIAQNYWELCQYIKDLPDDVIVYMLGHIEKDQNGNEKVKTIGKLLDEKITVEGMYTIVLKTVVKDGVYSFQTQNSGHDTVKSPIGLFDSFLIDNDLKMVDAAIREYYELSTVAPKEKVDEPVTVAEKIANEVEEQAGEPEPAEPVETVEAEVVEEQPKRRTRRTRQ